MAGLFYKCTTMIYNFRIYQCGDEDGDNIWVRADSEEEARAEVYHDYHSVDELLLMSVDDE